MSVHTTADGYHDNAREAVKAADAALAEFVTEVFIRDCWGSDQFREGFEQEVREALVRMHEIRKLIG